MNRRGSSSHVAQPVQRPPQLVQGSAATLSEVDSLGVELDDYDLFHATRADLLRALGRTGQVTDADRRALTLTANPAGQSLLRQRLTWD